MSDALTDSHTPASDSLAPVPCSTQPLARLLDQLAGLVQTLDADQYNARPDATRCGAIGGHVRHVLDHLDVFIAGIERGQINYDDRRRDTDIEHDPVAAVLAIKRYSDRLEQADHAGLVERVDVLTSMTRCGTLVRLPSTAARELAFVFSHTIHHNAIIGAIARALGVTLPEDFGMAPSTLAYRDEGGCAR